MTDKRVRMDKLVKRLSPKEQEILSLTAEFVSLKDKLLEGSDDDIKTMLKKGFCFECGSSDKLIGRMDHFASVTRAYMLMVAEQRNPQRAESGLQWERNLLGRALKECREEAQRFGHDEVITIVNRALKQVGRNRRKEGA